MERRPPLLLPNFVRRFGSFANTSQDSIGIELVFFVVLHVADVAELENHKPKTGLFLDLRNEYAELIPVCRIFRQLEDFFCTRLPGEAVALGHFHLGDTAEFADDRSMLPLDAAVLLGMAVGP